MIQERLLCTEGQRLDITVSLTHEKLLDVWPALAHWIAKNKNDLWLQRQVRMAAVEWAKEAVEADRGKHLWQDEQVVDVVRTMDRL